MMDGEIEDEQYPVHRSLKQRLSQVKNMFSVLKRNLEDGS